MSRWCRPRLERAREKHREDDAHEARGVIPRQFFLQDNRREGDEHREGDALLDDFELVAGKLAAEVTAAICRDHQAIFEEGDAPRNEDDREERAALEPLELEVAVPGDGHE